jgi:hypothetical protein
VIVISDCYHHISPPSPTSCVDNKTKIFHSHKTIVSNNEKITSTHADSLTEKLHKFIQLSQKTASSLESEASHSAPRLSRSESVQIFCRIAQKLAQSLYYILGLCIFKKIEIVVLRNISDAVSSQSVEF